jgi:DNA-binding MarR family transcriptional regulator
MRENLTDLVLSHRCSMGEGKAPRSPPASVMQRLAQLLSQAERGVTRQLRRVLEEEGCTVEQWRTLLLLADGVSHPMSEIAEFALLPAASLTRLIDRMVADNLAYRTADPADRRRVLVHSTPRGRALQRRLAERIERSQAAILAEADPDDVAQLAALLTQLADRLR